MDYFPTRRQFVQGLGGVGLGLLAGCGQLPLPAAPPEPTTIGILLSSRIPAQQALQQGLSDLGYADGVNITLHYRSADGTEERLPELAAELSQLPVKVIVTGGPTAIRAAKRATDTIPIVMATSSEPIGTGLVDSLAHPGGNVTGLTRMSAQLSAKRLQLLQETCSQLERVAILWNPSVPDKALDLAETQNAAPTLGLRLYPIEVRGAHDIERAFETASHEHAEAVVTLGDPVTIRARQEIVNIAAGLRLPVMYDVREFVDVGGLMAYGANFTAMWRRAAYFVDRILKGTSPADLPIEQPREFDFVVNLRTAQALGLSIPPHVLLQATEVIQ
jgi:putative tryptophan/tyrosine transport system substrate-binding protein